MSLTASYWRLDVQEDILDLLHTMGASRRYIMRELARANFVQTASAAGCGMILAFALLSIAWLLGGDSSPQALRTLSGGNFIMALLIPLLLGGVAASATIWAVRLHYTAFREVKQ